MAAQGSPTGALDTTGATFLVACTTTTSASTDFTDSRGGTWTRVVGPLTLNDSTSIWISSPPTTGTGTTFSIITNPNVHDTLLVAAFSGIATASLERSASQIQNGLASGAAISSGVTAPTIVADQVVIGCSQLSNNASFTWTATGGATLAASLGFGNAASTGALSYKIVSTTGTQAATFTANATGNAGTAVGTFKAAVVDTQAPTTPAGVNVTAVASFENDLAWTASTDNVGVCRYNLRRCSGTACTPSTIISQPSGTSYQDTGLTSGTLYRYTVQADDCTQTSSQSGVVEATTLAETECNVVWTAPVGGTAPTLYTVRLCGTTAASCQPALTLTTTTPPTTTLKITTCPQPVSCVDVSASAGGASSAATGFVCATGVTQTVPILSVSPLSLTFAATVNGANPAAQTLTVTNGTASTMNWTVGDDQAWLLEAPSSGTNTTPLTVTVSIAGLTAGTYQANITVTAPGATNSPIVIPVTLNLSPAVTPTTGRSGRVR